MFGRGRWNARGISKAKLKPDLYGLQCLHRNFLHWESLLPAPSTPTAAPVHRKCIQLSTIPTLAVNFSKALGVNHSFCAGCEPHPLGTPWLLKSCSCPKEVTDVDKSVLFFS